MEELKGVGYKNRVSAWVLLTGSIISLILMVFASVSKTENYVIFTVLCLLIAIIFLISFVVEVIRPKTVVFLSNNSVKIWKGFTWEMIPFDNIERVDYKLNFVRKYETMLLNTGSLIVESKNRKYVVRDIKSVSDCYEEVLASVEEHRNTKGNQSKTGNGRHTI